METTTLKMVFTTLRNIFLGALLVHFIVIIAFGIAPKEVAFKLLEKSIIYQPLTKIYSVEDGKKMTYVQQNNTSISKKENTNDLLKDRSAGFLTASAIIWVLLALITLFMEVRRTHYARLI